VGAVGAGFTGDAEDLFWSETVLISSRASSLPQGLGAVADAVFATTQCGSGLAREEGGTFNIDAS